jgi:hypothetical protein
MIMAELALLVTPPALNAICLESLDALNVTEPSIIIKKLVYLSVLMDYLLFQAFLIIALRALIIVKLVMGLLLQQTVFLA